jgi:hypothetical protein
MMMMMMMIIIIIILITIQLNLTSFFSERFSSVGF